MMCVMNTHSNNKRLSSTLKPYDVPLKQCRSSIGPLAELRGSRSSSLPIPSCAITELHSSTVIEYYEIMDSDDFCPIPRLNSRLSSDRLTVMSHADRCPVFHGYIYDWSFEQATHRIFVALYQCNSLPPHFHAPSSIKWVLLGSPSSDYSCYHEENLSILSKPSLRPPISSFMSELVLFTFQQYFEDGLLSPSRSLLSDPYWPATIPKLRTMLVDWVMELSSVIRLKKECFYHAIELIDKVVRASTTDYNICPKSSKFQLVSSACLFISTKLVQPDSSLILFENLTESLISKEELMVMEGILLRILDWRLRFPTIFNVLDDLISLGDVIGLKRRHDLSIRVYALLDLVVVHEMYPRFDKICLALAIINSFEPDFVDSLLKSDQLSLNNDLFHPITLVDSIVLEYTEFLKPLIVLSPLARTRNVEIQGYIGESVYELVNKKQKV
ncbi:hypothetical protein GEMRC1_003010 [Eukaryota sp. GEM-RC1]